MMRSTTTEASPVVLSQAFEEVWQRHHTENVGLRNAAYMTAIQRVYRAKCLAGFG